jgi:hypothetical protein
LLLLHAAGELRAASDKLLLAASGQVVGAAVALLVPAPAVAFSGCVLGSLTGYRALDVLWMLVSCHGHVHGALAAHYWVFFVLVWVLRAAPGHRRLPRSRSLLAAMPCLLACKQEAMGAC